MSITYSNVQKANCVLWLAETNDISKVQEKFKSEFCKCTPPCPIPLEAEIQQWFENFKKTGTYDAETRPKFGLDNAQNGPTENEAKHVSFEGANAETGTVPVQNVHKDPSGVDLHVHDYEKETGLLNFFGFRKIHKCHPFKMHLKGKLDEGDKATRKAFSEHELGRIHAIHHLSHRIWFGGEATFYTNGRVACHNLVYLKEDSDSPDSKKAPPPEGPCVTVWAALNYEGLLGPYITQGPADTNAYNLFLRKFAYELKQIQRLKCRLENPIFMHDDSKLHDNPEAQEMLYQEFPFYWVGPGSKFQEFPKLSPDLNPLAFFLWGHIKKAVYEKPIEADDTTELANRIHHAFTEIMPEMLEASVKAYKERLKLVAAYQGDLVDVHDDDENKFNTYMYNGAMPYYLY